MTSKPVLLLGNLVSIIVTIAGIFQALSWTIAGAIILAILSITTLVPSRNATTSRSPGRKTAGHSSVEAKPFRDKMPEKQPIRTRQAPPRDEPVSDARTETPRP